MKKTATNDNMAALSMRERISYGCGGMGNAIVLAIVTTYLLFFYTDVIGLKAGIVGSILLASKIFDGISDLIMGFIVDKTKSKFGKARCWILWLCIPYAVSGVLMFLLPAAWPEAIKYVYVFITYNLVNTIMYTGVCVPYNAMNCLLTKNQYERGLLGTTNVLGNVIGQIVVNTFMLKLVLAFGNNQTAWIIASAIFGTVGLIMHLICFSQTVERNNQTEKVEEPGFLISVKSLFKNKYWLMMAGSATVLFFMNGVFATSTMYFAKEIMGNEETVAGLTNSMNIVQMIVFCFAFVFIKRLGKGNSFKVGSVICALGYGFQILAGSNYTLLLACGVLKGLGMGMGGACLAGMISDTIEYGEWKTGVRCVGVGNAANTFAQKIGMGVGTALVGWLLDAAGYSGSLTVQPAAALSVIKICFTYIPFVCSVIICLIIINYKLDGEYPMIIKNLAERHRGKTS